jgi:predicted ester cyclase
MSLPAIEIATGRAVRRPFTQADGRTQVRGGAVSNAGQQATAYVVLIYDCGHVAEPRLAIWQMRQDCHDPILPEDHWSQGKDVMPLEEQKDVYRRATEEIWNAGNPAAVDTFFAPDYRNHNPFAGTTPDREGMKEAVRIMRIAFPDFHSTVEDVIAEGDLVVGRATLRGTHLGELMGIPPTGRQMAMASISALRIVGGQIVERWNITDSLGMLQQLGIIDQLGPPG